MVREINGHSNGHHDDHVTLSSIALLQERFRQLEKMKELRQEKELLKMLSESQRLNAPPEMAPHRERQTTSFSGSEQTFNSIISAPLMPRTQLSLSLWPNSQIKYEDSRGLRMDQGPPSADLIAKSCFADHVPVETESYIDTSLRL